ncbi:docking protein 2 [Clarias gariepinus]|uniref:docking protein 2 n=1 Tax=Clarias gariepinus TaxID=13013 RepID=UPI00234D2EA6|nr:docking protein 2 [Clarias gariepinus]
MMEGDVRKKGMLYQQQQRFGKKWKKIWAEAVADSMQSVSRLELYEFSKSSMKDSKKRAEGKKVIVMRDCIKIREKEDEGCPKECRTFLLETADKTHMFASPTLEVYSWISELCKLAFPLNQAECRSQKQEHQPVDMQENTLYATTECVRDFLVVTVATEAAVRCKLYGEYILTPKHDSLLLKDKKTKQVLLTWPYRYVRKFGQDMLTFNFEAGRRCESGEGYFEFATSHSENLFNIIGDSLKKLPKGDAPGAKLKDEESTRENSQKPHTPPTQVKHPKKKLTASSSLSSISVSNNPGKDSKGKNINSIPPPSGDVQDPVYALVSKPKSHPKSSKDHKNQQLGPLPDFFIHTEEEEEDVPLPPPKHTSFKSYEAETVYSEVKNFDNYGRRNEAFDSTGDFFYERHSPNLTVCPDNMDHHSSSPSKFNLSNDTSYITGKEEQLGMSMERLAIHCAPDAYGAESMYSQEVDYYDYGGNEEFEDNVDLEYFYPPPPCDTHIETGLSNSEGSQAQGFSTYDNLPKRL